MNKIAGSRAEQAKLNTQFSRISLALKFILLWGMTLLFPSFSLAQINPSNNAAANTAARAGSQTTVSSLTNIMVTNPFANTGLFRYRFGSNGGGDQSNSKGIASQTPDGKNSEKMFGGLSAGDFGNWNVWATPVVSSYKYNIEPYTSTGTVVIGMAGLEYNYEDTLTSGVSISVNDTNSVTTYNNGTYKTVGLTVSPYAVYQINDYLALNSSFGIGGSNPSINVGGVNGTTSYNSFFGVIGLSNRTDFGNFMLQPRISYTYYIDKLGAYTNGAGTYNSAYNTYLGQTQAGAQLSYDTKVGAQPFIAAYGFINTWNSNQLATTPSSVYPSTYRVIAGVNGSNGVFYGTVSYQIERSVSQFRIYGGILF